MNKAFQFRSQKLNESRNVETIQRQTRINSEDAEKRNKINDTTLDRPGEIKRKTGVD